MKKPILTYLLMTLTTFCLGQPNKADCEQFKTGTFTYKESAYDDVKITRTETEQKEYDKKSKLKINYTIRWTGDCEYELIQVKSSKKKLNVNKGSVIKVKITKIMGDSYEYVAECEGDVTQLTLVKLKSNKKEK